jgi:NAD-dependent deacetylase
MRENDINKAIDFIVSSNKIVIFTGAGISTESGIPDFRSPGGLWDRYDPNDFVFDKFLNNEEARRKYWTMSEEAYSLMKNAKPNKAHIAIAELENIGKLDCIITQNVDGLHQNAGNSEDKIIQLHGTMKTVSCLSCREKWRYEEISERIKSGESVPYCKKCNGILKPDTISFGQRMPERETTEATRRSESCDLFIVIGSSLVVYPAAVMPVRAKENGARLIIINRSPTPYDGYADLVIRNGAGDTMESIIKEVKKQLINEK